MNYFQQLHQDILQMNLLIEKGIKYDYSRNWICTVGWILGDILFDKFLKAPIEDLADKIADTIKNNRKG